MKNLVWFVLSVIQVHVVFSQSYVPDVSNPNVKVNPVATVRAYAFALSEVELLPSPFYDAMQADVAYLKSIDPDRLLAQFRTHAGLKPKGEIYGGWESLGLAGHTLGHYLSACAMHYAASGDKTFLDRVNYIVDELEACQQARKTGYIGAILKEDTVFMEVSQGNIRSRGFDLNGAWSPWYTVHKIMAGLLDAYLYVNNEKALLVEQRMADWTATVLKDLSDEQVQKMLLCEYGGMNEVLVNTYAFTGDKKYLDLSYKFHDKSVLDSLAMQIDVLPGKHSNTQVPKAIGTVRRYELTGNKKDLVISSFFWNTVVDHHTYAPGGNSNYEYLGKRDHLSDQLTDNTMETCNTYNMLKLTRHLFALEPSARYMDFYERALYNHILASQHHTTGMMCYFVPLRLGTQKAFNDQYNTFTCCVGSGMENHVKYNESIFYKGKDGDLYINLFIPSKLTWKERGATVTLDAGLPADGTVSATLHLAQSQIIPIYIRKPYWASQNVTVKVNGIAVKRQVINKAGYIVLHQQWNDGDVIEVSFPMTLHTMSTPDNVSRRAIFYGPVLLAGNLGNKEPDPAQGVPVLVTNKPLPSAWIEKYSDAPLAYRTTGVGKPADVILQPFYTIQDEFYTVYWDVFTPQGWEKQQSTYEEQKRIAADLEKRTVDILRPGEMQPERDHHFTSDKTETGESHTRKFRTALEGGFFSFTMKTLPDTPLSLICTYWGMDNRGRTFDIFVDDEKIATEDLNKYKDSRFYDIRYKIPSKLTAGKHAISIRFQPHDKQQAGPVYGVRLVKD
jgi:DUF1680 family protein